MSHKNRRNRWNSDNYQLPSERGNSDIEVSGDTEGDDNTDLFAVDDLELADNVARSLPYADQLIHKATLRDKKREAREDLARNVRINPVSADRGTLGGQQRVWTAPNPADPNAAQTKQVALWNAYDITETLPVTITFSPVTPVNPGAFSGDPTVGVLRPYGIVQWGTRATANNVEVDIGQGVQFTIGASMVSLQVALEQTPGTAEFMDLSGEMSFYEVDHEVPVTRTKYFDADGVTTTTTIVRPKFAQSVVIRRPIIGQGLDVNFLDSQGNIVDTFSIAAGTTMVTPVPMSGEVVAVQVIRAGVAFMGSFTAIFQLGL